MLGACPLFAGCGTSPSTGARSLRPCLPAPPATQVYCGDVRLSNGTAAHLMTRQRPQLVFGRDGTTPQLMVMGGSFNEYNQGTTSLERTFVFEFDTTTATPLQPSG